MHGGSIEAASAGPGQGSTFTLDLPTSILAVRIETPRASAPAVPLERRVLIVDDNEDVARIMALLIERLGGRTRVAFDGNAALQAVAEFQPNIVFLDIGMPGLDGYETCRRIRRQPFGQNITIVALTGWGKDQDRWRAEDAGFDLHLTKPADPATLQEILAAALPSDATPPLEAIAAH
jgi:CheY-like chemotaxis protein